jgi:hypothetical protein
MAEVLTRDINLNLIQDEMNVALLEPIFFDASISEIFRVDTNARTKKSIPFIKFKQNLLRKRTGCKPEEVEAVEISRRCFDIQDQQFRIPLCQDEFEDTVFMGMTQRGVRKTDLTPTLMARLLVDAAQVAIRKDLINLAFFGKSSMATPAGAEYLDITNGLWSYYIPLLQDEGKLQFTPQNTPLVGGTGDATTFLRNIYKNQKNVLKAVPNAQKFIKVDRGVFEAYREDLEATQGTGGGNTTITEGGKEVLDFYGMRIIEFCEWDDVLQSLGIDTTATPGNLAMLTTRDNLWFGTDSSNPRQELDIWYHKKDKINYLDSLFNVGFNYLHDEFFSVGANEAVLTALKNL